MLFASSIAKIQDPEAAAEAVLQEVTSQLQGRSCDLAFGFISGLPTAGSEPILRRIRQSLKDSLFLGCTGGGVVGGDKEMEFTPALSLAAAHLPGVELHPFTISPEDLEESREPGFWIEKLGCSPQEQPVGVLLPEPFSCDAMSLLATLNRVYPKMPVIGGIASGTDADNGGVGLFFNDRIVNEGAVGVLLTGNVSLETIVSQGCRPIGRPYIITKAEGNIVLELAGVAATEALRNLFVTLSAPDKALARRALLLGVVMNEQKERFGRGDFLIRNLIGMDPQSGGMAIGDRIQVGQTVQFQVRDADTSREDLGVLLAEHSGDLKSSPPAGALLFSCLGRGRDIYGEPHYDSRTIQAAVGPCPMAGFFCNGEIGPVGGRNFIHGFTSSLGLFRPR